MKRAGQECTLPKRMLSHLQDTWSCSSVCDHEGTGWPAAGGEQEDGKGLWVLEEVTGTLIPMGTAY